MKKENRFFMKGTIPNSIFYEKKDKASLDGSIFACL